MLAVAVTWWLSDDHHQAQLRFALGLYPLLEPEMRTIPAGQFEMGDLNGGGKDDEKPVHTVRFTKAFQLGIHEVTFDQYDQFALVTGRELPDDEGWGRGTRPVINVSWVDAVAYAEWLSEETGKRYRLPSEAEWEYAARAGSDGPFNLPCEDFSEKLCDEKVPCLDRIGWYKWNSGGKLHPVAEKQPNAWGLYDMHGNVLEWCQDRCGMYPSGEQTNYMGPGTGEGRVLRGGSWMDQARYVRVANRSCNTPTYRYKLYGFRIVYVEAP
jgi:formylglycine-generating enzyme required for sulfatase activity